MVKQVIDIANKKYGKLTVVSRSNRKEPNGVIFWICKCDCGETRTIAGTMLRNGRRISCGCLSGRIPLTEEQLQHSSKIKYWGVEVIVRDKQCLRCKSKENLHAHHIIPKEILETAYMISNGGTLCAYCHKWFHVIHGREGFGLKEFLAFLDNHRERDMI